MNSQKKLKISPLKLKRLAQITLQSEGIDGIELCISIVDNATIKALNNQYLKKNQPTDVLAFSMSDGEFGDVNQHILGDVIISAERALEYAAEMGNEVNYELALYLVHGILHLVGYTDKTKKGFNLMANKQKEILTYYA